MHSADELQWNLLDRMHKALRLRGMKATTMAEALGVHRNTVNNYLSGKTPVDRRTLIAWAEITDVPLKWLETGVMPPSGGPDAPPNNGENLRRLTEIKARRARSRVTTGRYLPVAGAA